MTLAELRQQAVEVAGLDLETDEANALINEAYRELCFQSEWIRGYVPIGPGVAGQDAYDIPARVIRILKLDVDGAPYDPSNIEEIQGLRRGDLSRRSNGFHWQSYTEDGTEQIGVYPTPSGGEEITIYAVLRPAADLSDDTDSPVTPPELGDRAILNYVQANVLGDSEDDTERRDYFLGEFGRLALEMKALRFSRTSRKNARVKIRGITA